MSIEEKWKVKIESIKEHGVNKSNQMHKPILEGFSTDEAVAYCEKQLKLFIEHEEKD